MFVSIMQCGGSRASESPPTIHSDVEEKPGNSHVSGGSPESGAGPHATINQTLSKTRHLENN